MRTPRCENCPPTGKACLACRNARRRARYAELNGGLVRPNTYEHRPRCGSCPPKGALCRDCTRRWRAVLYQRRMADPAWAENWRKVNRERARAKAAMREPKPIGRPKKVRPFIEPRPLREPSILGPATPGAPDAPTVERRNWDLSTCLFCLRRGRFPGPYCKPEHEAAAKGRRTPA